LDRRERFEAEALPHFKALYGTAYRMTRSAADADDLVQETYLRAYRAYDSFAAGTNIRAWLFTILHRARTDQLRRTLRRRETAELPEQANPAPPPQDALAAARDLWRAVMELPEAFRTAVVLRDVEEFSYQEIATIMEVPIGTVMSRIHRGRALLRRVLTEARP
jgi:RNA polymerase sigma-70 factor (ECF subfamily)